MTALPRITIGLPVYNGATTLADSVATLRQQTFGDFELLISDNASTDSTGELARALAAQDPRIRYLRQPENIGVCRNYSFVARIARGEFLKWATASDYCAPPFLERCLETLQQNPDAVLAVPRTRFFEGDVTHAWDYAEDIDAVDELPFARLAHVMQAMRMNNAMNGLIRLEALRKTRFIDDYRSADMVLMGHLALLGKFLLVEERLFFRRMEMATATALQDTDTVRRFYHPQMDRRAILPNWRRHLGWFQAVTMAPMPLGERGRALRLVTRKAYGDRYALVDDLREAWRFARGKPLVGA